MKYPILYPPDATDFFNMGQGPITTSLTATVAEDRNGSFIFEAEVLTDDAIYPLLQTNSIIKADAGHLLKDQRFKIKRIVPTSDGKATIYAEHVSYLSQELSLKPDVRFTSLNANAAIARWKSNLNETNPFVVDSDIPTVGSTSWRVDKVENPRQALGGVEGSLLDVYGGEYRFDNYHISLLKKRGTTANTVLAYGRNITSLEQETNITSTYTSVYPYAKYTDDSENEQLVTIDGYTVHCANVASFPNRVVKSVDFSGEFEHNEVPTKAKLKTLAEKYITDNDFGIPSVSIRVSFLDLSKTADYADYQALEEVNLCDDVRVVFPKLGVDTVAKVTRTVWNVLSESYDEIEIGEKRASLSTIISDQTKQIEKAEKNANGAITAANGKNTIFTGLYGVDGLGEPTATRINDTWFKPNGQYVEMYTWNGTIWKFEMSTAPDPALIAEIEDNKTKAEEAQAAAEDAKTAGENAELAAQEASDKADQAQVDSQTALDKANNAVDKATETAGKVGGLETAVGLVTEQSANAVDVANQAKGNADTALGKANSAIGTAQDALNQSALAKSQAEEAIEKYLGMGMVPAWSWSADGTDRFTTVYPGENYAKNSKRTLELSNVTNNRNQLNGDVPYNLADLAGKTVTISVEIEVKNSQPQTSGGSFRIGCEANMPRTNGGTFYLGVWENLSAGQTIATKRISRTLSIPNDIVAERAEGLHLYVQANGDYFRVSKTKIEIGDTPTIYTPAPSEDYANAVPSYIGFAIEPSDNPADYTWIRNPEKVEGEVKVELTHINGELKRKVSQETFDQLNSTVINHSTLISQNQNAIKLKADQSTVDTINQTVSDHSTAIDLNAEAIALKANQSTVDSLTGRVTEAEGSITTIAGQVALKANQTVVDTLNDTVNSLNSELTVQAGKITGLTTVTDGHTTKIGALELQAGQFSLSLSSVQNDLNGMEIGGRNVLVLTGTKTSKVCDSAASFTSWDPYTTPSKTTLANMGVKTGDKMTLLFDWNITQNGSKAFVYGNFRCEWVNATGTYLTAIKNPMATFSATNKSGKAKVTVTIPEVALTATTLRFRVDNSVLTLNIANVMLVKGNKAIDWSPAPEDMATVTEMSNLTQTVNTIQSTVANKADKTTVTQLANQWQQTTDLANGHTSQISSLGDAINLRVEKDDIINQININEQGVLIAGEKVHITGLTTIDDAVIKTANIVDLNVTEAKLGNLSVSTAKIADAAITSAKIGTAAIGTAHIGDGVITNAKIGNLAVSGAKIQDATISSAKIINLDASKITANTLSAITTNTGALNVTGWLTFSTDNRGIRGSFDHGAEDEFNPRWFIGDYTLSHRRLRFDADVYKNNSGVKGSFLYFTETYYGPDFFKFRQYDNKTSHKLLARTDLTADTFQITRGWNEGTGVVLRADGSGRFGNGVEILQPGLECGRYNAPSGYDTILFNNLRTDIASMKLNKNNFYVNDTRTDLADFQIGKDSSSINGGRVVQSKAVYNRTYSGTANMIVTEHGTLGRTTSARKYKADIQPAYDVIAKAKKVMDINPSSWWDKGELADGVAKERYYGFIADEFAEIGLNEVVVYRDGEIESLAYDRIPMYHNVILNEHEKEIQELKAKVQQLENEIRVLQAA